MSSSLVKRVASLWVGSELGTWERLCLQSFVSNGVAVDLHVYADVRGVPAGVTIKDASKTVPEALARENRHQPGTYADFSDLFRYTLLSCDEVVWVDTDVYMLNPLYPKQSYVMGFEGLGRINNAVLGYPPGSPLATFLLEQCRARRGGEYAWGALGPGLVTEGVAKYRLWSKVQKEATFYPVPWRQAWRFFDPNEAEDVRRSAKASSAAHLWNEALRGSAFRVKEHLPAHGSFARDLTDRYSVESEFKFPTPQQFDHRWEEWRWGLDPSDQRRTILFTLRKIMRSAPHPWLAMLNWLSYRLRQSLKLS